jgi:protein TonB
MGSASASTGDSERRIRSRWKPASLLYVELDGSNGGVVLNISESGLAMHAAQCVPQESISRLRFKLPLSRQEIVASGQVAWKGETRKELGVRFLDLPESTQLEIRKWIQADSVPRRLPQKVRPFPLNRVRAAAAPVATDPTSNTEVQTSPRGAEGRAGYPTSSAIARAIQQAKEEERAGPLPASRTASGPQPPAAPAAGKMARPEAERRPAQPGEAAALASSASSGARSPRALGARASAPARRPLISTVLPLGQDVPSVRVRAAAAHDAPQRVRSRRARRLVLGTALILTSFVLGLATGGRGLAAAAGELSAGLANAWHALEAYTAMYPAEPPAKDPELESTAANRAPTAFPRAGEASSPVASAAEPPSKSAAPRASAGTASAASQGRSIDRGAPLAAAPREAGRVAAPKAPPVATRAEDLQEKTAKAKPPAAAPEHNPVTSAAPVPPSEGTTGTVVVHSRLRAIRIPAELRFLSQAQGEGLQVGEMLSGDAPAYPEEALRDRAEGTVSLRAVIGRDGAITSAEAVNGPEQLAIPALAAVRGWRYEPTMLGGQAVEWEEDITVVFRLQKPPAGLK